MKYFLNFILSLAWSFVGLFARVLIRIGVLRPVRLNVPVISVGNIQVAGAGKTPLVAKIANEAHARNLKVCILSRGYRGKWEYLGGIILPGNEPVGPSLCGDEVSLLHQLCPFAWIGVGADRVFQYKVVRSQMEGNPDLVILDDGFQNWKIFKDTEIVAWTSAKPWIIPFRDAQKALNKADLVVWTKGRTPPSKNLDVPLVRIQYQLSAELANFGPLWLITGIADGTSAYKLCLAAGYNIVRYTFLRDHHRYAEKQIHGLLEDATSRGWKIAVTGKDWVKWQELGVDPSQVIVLEPNLVLQSGQENWSHVLWGE